MARLTQRELRAARMLGEAIPKLTAFDVVFATLPDGSDVLVKGRHQLDRIIASGITAGCNIAQVSVMSAESAACLEQVLGRDGSFSHPGPMGHA